MKQVIIVLASIVIVIGLAAAVYRLVPHKGEIVDTWQSSNSPFGTRIIKQMERGGFAPVLDGAYFDFQAMPAGSDSWREIMTLRYDGPIDIPTKNVSFVNDTVANVFLGWRYAITTDGGSSWRVSSPRDFLPADQAEQCKYNCIDSIQMNSDGSGLIYLHIIGRPVNETTVLETKDFGMSWK
jgi:hypothetical protein